MYLLFRNYDLWIAIANYYYFISFNNDKRSLKNFFFFFPKRFNILQKFFIIRWKKNIYKYLFYQYLPNITIFCFFFFIYLFPSYLIKINIQDRLANWKNNVFQNYSWNNLVFKIIYYIIIYFICIIELKLYSWNFFFFFLRKNKIYLEFLKIWYW